MAKKKNNSTTLHPPSLPTCLGSDKKYNQQKLMENEQQNKNFGFSLLKIAKDIYYPSKLQLLGSQLVHSVVPSSDVKRKNVSEARFFVRIGSTKSFQDSSATKAICNPTIKSKGIEGSMKRFLNSKFQANETSFIEKTFKDEKVIHIVLFGRQISSYHSVTRRRNQDNIIPSVSFIADRNSAILL
jgi:hypothetical protein